MSNDINDTKKLIQNLREQRQSLGDNTNVSIPKVRYKRVKRNSIIQIIQFGYTLLIGMMLSIVLLHQSIGAFIVMVIICGGLIYILLKE